MKYLKIWLDPIFYDFRNFFKGAAKFTHVMRGKVGTGVLCKGFNRHSRVKKKLKKDAFESTREILMVGPFPPPVHGASIVNLSILKKLNSASVFPKIFDTAEKGGKLNRTIWGRIKRFPNVMKALVRFLLSKHTYKSSLYISISCGLGQIYEIIFIILARIQNNRICLHHHNFNYIDRPSRITRLLTFVAGNDSIHITQSPRMAKSLKKIYASVRRVSHISNCIYIEDGTEKDDCIRSKLRVLGFISNISEEKGIYTFLDLMKRLESEGVYIKGRVAGPFMDKTAENKVLKIISELQNTSYVGAKYGATKKKFYKSIDVLVFPTLYVNEAEPLVINEALKMGVPVIAYGRGAIGECINPEIGLAIDRSNDFIDPAIEKIKEWLWYPDKFIEASQSSIHYFKNQYAFNLSQWKLLIEAISK